jgi:phospholipase/carboxylesterase
MQEETSTLAGLATTIVRAASAPELTVVLLHGYDMSPGDLSPFAHSITVPALFLLPRGPLTSHNGNGAWWGVDVEARAQAQSLGPRDLADEYPTGVGAARIQLTHFVEVARREYPTPKLVVGGFSQGGMLACDAVLQGSIRADGLVMLSASRIRRKAWEHASQRLRALPVFVSHGRGDTDLAFAAGERLHDFVRAAGARATWVPFDGGHEIPLIVWRNLRIFLNALLN